MKDEKYMQRCLELARQGFGNVAPNPMVGCVLVYKDKIIGEGFHQKYGEAHAEVNAVNSVGTRHVVSLQNSTLYVNLEPCAHFGKTPPCVDLLIKKNISKVVIANLDSNPIVRGKGIKKLMDAGVQVKVGVLENEAKELNKRFFTFHEKKRPFIILKWAETKDGFLAPPLHLERGKGGEAWISNELSRKLVHKWRSEEQAILVGTNTALTDNPQLNVRLWRGKNPLRMVIDKDLKLPKSLHLFDQKIPTVVFTTKKQKAKKNLEFIQLNFKKNIVPQICNLCYEKRIQSLIVEGGEKLLTTFIKENWWDEARVFVGNKIFKKGIAAPEIKGKLISKEKIVDDELLIFKNKFVT